MAKYTTGVENSPATFIAGFANATCLALVSHTTASDSDVKRVLSFPLFIPVDFLCLSVRFFPFFSPEEGRRERGFVALGVVAN